MSSDPLAPSLKTASKAPSPWEASLRKFSPQGSQDPPKELIAQRHNASPRDWRVDEDNGPDFKLTNGMSLEPILRRNKCRAQEPVDEDNVREWSHADVIQWGVSCLPQKYRTQENITEIELMFEHVSGALLLKWQSETLRESRGKLPLKVLPFLEVALEDLRDRALAASDQGMSTPTQKVAHKTCEADKASGGDALPVAHKTFGGKIRKPSKDLESTLIGKIPTLVAGRCPLGGSGPRLAGGTPFSLEQVRDSQVGGTPRLQPQQPQPFEAATAESDVNTITMSGSSKSLTNVRSRSWKSRRQESPRPGSTSWRRGSRFGYHQKTAEMKSSGDTLEFKQTADDDAELANFGEFWRRGLRNHLPRSKSPSERWLLNGTTEGLPLDRPITQPVKIKAPPQEDEPIDPQAAVANCNLYPQAAVLESRQVSPRTRDQSPVTFTSTLLMTRERSGKQRRQASPRGSYGVAQRSKAPLEEEDQPIDPRTIVQIVEPAQPKLESYRWAYSRKKLRPFSTSREALTDAYRAASNLYACARDGCSPDEAHMQIKYGRGFTRQTARSSSPKPFTRIRGDLGRDLATLNAASLTALYHNQLNA